MRISRVYFIGSLKADALVSLPAETSHYLSHVLRLRVDDCLHLFNAEDGEFLVCITGIKKKEVQVQVQEQKIDALAHAQETRLQIHLALGLSRGDRMDIAVQKSTELGVKRITPVYTEHGEVKLKADRAEKKLRHWQKIAINASEQCGRIDIPLIDPPCLLTDWQSNESAGTKLMLDPRGEDRFPVTQEKGEIGLLNLLIGPEGGFSEMEVIEARGLGFSVVTLGSRVLRTETAPIAALAILQYLYGDM